MKKAIITMVAMFVLTVWPFGGLWYKLFAPVIGGGIEQSFFCSIYVGIILLSGIVVGCTDIILAEIRSTKDAKNENNKEKQSD